MEEYILFVDQKLSIIKMSIFLKLIYILVVQSRSNLSSFCGIPKVDSKFIWKCKEPKVNKSVEEE